MTPLRRGWRWRAIGPKKPTLGRKYFERAAALRQSDALKVLHNALSEGDGKTYGIGWSASYGNTVAWYVATSAPHLR